MPSSLSVQSRFTVSHRLDSYLQSAWHKDWVEPAIKEQEDDDDVSELSHHERLAVEGEAETTPWQRCSR